MKARRDGKTKVTLDFIRRQNMLGKKTCIPVFSEKSRDFWADVLWREDVDAEVILEKPFA